MTQILNLLAMLTALAIANTIFFVLIVLIGLGINKIAKAIKARIIKDYEEQLEP